MSNNEWITDRRPTAKDCVGAERMPDSNQVWVMHEGRVVACPYAHVVLGCPWQPIVMQKPEPYVKPKRYRVGVWAGHMYGVYEEFTDYVIAGHIPTREAAEHIAAIYEEVTP